MSDRLQVNDSSSRQSKYNAPTQKLQVLLLIREAQSIGLNLVTASMLLAEQEEVTHG